MRKKQKKITMENGNKKKEGKGTQIEEEKESANC